MDFKRKGKADWVHILMKGEKTHDTNPSSDDDYLQQFRCNNLSAILVPILQFKYNNLEQLAKLIQNTRNPYGLIITSPRVVTSLREAMKFSKDENLFKNLSEDHVFVVGERTSQHWASLMGLEFNKSSTESGNGEELAKFINNQCFNNHINLIYPKSALANNSIEQILEQNGNISVETMQVYDTRAVDDISSELLSALSRNLSEIVDKTTVNLIMFSPSGVVGIYHIDWKHLGNQLMDLLGHEVEFEFSSIGENTATALRNKGFNVCSVASKPNPKSLVESILKSQLGYRHQTS